MSSYPVLIALLLYVQFTFCDLHNANTAFGKRYGEGCSSTTFYSQGFENYYFPISNEGFSLYDHGYSPLDSTWMQGASERFPAQDGSPNGYAVFYSSTSTNGTISYWIMTGTVDYSLGVNVSFWTRTATDIAVAPTRLFVRYSNKGYETGFTTNTSSDFGYFTATPLVINEAMTQEGYPITWTQYSFNIPPQVGISGRIAFHFYMQAAAGYQTRFIGIDSLSLARFGFYSQGFVDVPYVFGPEGYDGFDHSSASVEHGVIQGNVAMFSAAYPPENSYAGIYSETSTAGTVSNWLTTGYVDYTNGVTGSFWTRTTDTQTVPTRLYVRYSDHAADHGFTTNSPTDLGYYTGTALVINEAMTVNGYPTQWTKYSFTIPSQPGVLGRIAFHLLVDSVSANEDRYIGLDSILFTTCPESVSHGECHPDCSCYSGFSGPSCDIRPPSGCTFLPTETLGTNFVPLFNFTTNTSRLIFSVKAPLEQSKFINPSLNDDLALSAPYSLGTYIVFGNGTECDYPGSNLWSRSAYQCQDRWEQQLPWSSVRDLCKFSDEDGDLVFTQTVKISRVYALKSLDNITDLFRTESIEKVLSFAFPKSVPVSTNLAVTSHNNKTEVALISAAYSPMSDSWNIAFRVLSGFPYIVVNVTGYYYEGVNNTNLNVSISNENSCDGSVSCLQTITAKIPGCQALNGELGLALYQNCASACTPNIVRVTANPKTGNSCAFSNTIHFKSTSLGAFSSSNLTVTKTQFDTAETTYFGATFTTDEYDVSLLSFTVDSVCVTIGQGPCAMINYTIIPAVGGANVAFSVALAQLKSLKTSAGVETFSFVATVSVSSINKRTQHASAIVNVGSTIFVTSQIDPQLTSDLITFTFGAPSQMTQNTFKQGMTTVLDITSDEIEIVQYFATQAKRSTVYTIKAQFYILGDKAKEKQAELLQKVQNNDPSLLNSGFEAASVEITASTTTGSNTGNDAPEQYVSSASCFGFSIVISVLMMLLL